jgi:hypothetical protein
VDQPFSSGFDRGVRVAGAIERKRVRGETVEGQLTEEINDGSTPSLGVPPAAQPGGDRRHLCAANRQAAAMELTTERQ